MLLKENYSNKHFEVLNSRNVKKNLYIFNPATWAIKQFSTKYQSGNTESDFIGNFLLNFVQIVHLETLAREI